MIVDTSALLAFFDSSEPDHVAVKDVIEGSTEPLVVSPYVVAELDYLVGTRLGVAAELLVLAELAGGAWDLANFDGTDLGTATEIIRTYGDLDIGIADASIVILAERHRTRQVATLDHRHFRALRPISGGYFDLVPTAHELA